MNRKKTGLRTELEEKWTNYIPNFCMELHCTVHPPSVTVWKYFKFWTCYESLVSCELH